MQHSSKISKADPVSGLALALNLTRALTLSAFCSSSFLALSRSLLLLSSVSCSPRSLACSPVSLFLLSFSLCCTTQQSSKEQTQLPSASPQRSMNKKPCEVPADSFSADGNRKAVPAGAGPSLYLSPSCSGPMSLTAISQVSLSLSLALSRSLSLAVSLCLFLSRGS